MSCGSLESSSGILACSFTMLSLVSGDDGNSLTKTIPGSDDVIRKW